MSRPCNKTEAADIREMEARASMWHRIPGQAGCCCNGDGCGLLLGIGVAGQTARDNGSEIHLGETGDTFQALKPAFGYHGGKGRYSGWILEHLPVADCYVEPFAGSAAVLFAKPPSRVEVLNDLDTEIWAFLTALREFPDELERACRLTPYSRHEFRTVRAKIDVDDCDDIVERGRRFFVIVSQGFAAVPSTKGWSRPEPDLSEALKASRLIDRFQACSTRLRNVHLECLDALEVLRRYDSNKTVFFIDPPYLWSTRSWAAGQRKKQDYRVEMMTDEEHEQLLATVAKLDARAVLAGRRSPMYDSALKEWQRLDGRNREVLWIKS